MCGCVYAYFYVWFIGQLIGVAANRIEEVRLHEKGVHCNKGEYRPLIFYFECF